MVQAEHGDLVIASVYVPTAARITPRSSPLLKSLIDWAAQLTQMADS